MIAIVFMWDRMPGGLVATLRANTPTIKRFVIGGTSTAVPYGFRQLLWVCVAFIGRLSRDSRIAGSSIAYASIVMFKGGPALIMCVSSKERSRPRLGEPS